MARNAVADDYLSDLGHSNMKECPLGTRKKLSCISCQRYRADIRNEKMCFSRSRREKMNYARSFMANLINNTPVWFALPCKLFDTARYRDQNVYHQEQYDDS